VNLKPTLVILGEVVVGEATVKGCLRGSISQASTTLGRLFLDSVFKSLA